MAASKTIRTYFEGSWHDGDVPIMKAADHGSWLGTTVFDGARCVNGLTPDLLAHCERVNRSAEALMIRPTMTPGGMQALIHEGLQAFPKGAAVYIRPMYWAIEGDATVVAAEPGLTGFAICLEEIPFSQVSTATLTTTRYCRPVLESSVVNAKAGCLYPNNARMLREARAKGFSNALVADALGNVAETATSNIFMVRDGVTFTPVPNGTFLAGITRARHMTNMEAAGMEIYEAVLSFDDFRAADEVFMSGNMSKVTTVTAFDDVQYQEGPVTRKVREMYWDWAANASG